jgi:two-component system OmpR family sensor kinase
MTLTNRFSIFLLSVLAVVLFGFTSALYLLAGSYLHRELDDRLNAELEKLTAAAEIKTPQLLQWEPEKHHLITGLDTGLEHARWIVRERTNQVVDHSKNLVDSPDFEMLLDATANCTSPDSSVNEPVTFNVTPPPSWQVRSKRLLPPSPTLELEPSSRTGRKRTYPELVMIAALSTKPIDQQLRALLLWSSALSVILWLSTAFMGRWLCHRALSPLHRMAISARDLPATEIRRRIPLPGTSDELEELGVAFNGLLGRVQIAMECRQRFASQASHQLRTPLAMLLGHLQVALRRDRTAEEYRRALIRAELKGQQLCRIIEALLFLTRAETEGVLPELTDIDLAEWIPGQVARWSGHERFPDIRFRLDETPIRVRAHPELLGQAFDNLLENACKYSSPGSPVQVRTERGEQIIKLLVQDAGVGIEQEDLAQLFEPFFRTRYARDQGIAGTGLGLAVVRRIASAFKGSIRVQSIPGRGSTFILELLASSADVALPVRQVGVVLSTEPEYTSSMITSASAG